MGTTIDFTIRNWGDIIIPLAVFIFSLIGLLWLRIMALNHLFRWVKKVKWAADIVIYRAIKRPLLILCVILSTYLGLAVSAIPGSWKSPVDKFIWTLFVFTLVLAALNVLHGLITIVGRHLNLPSLIPIFRNVASIIVIAVSVLVVMDIWGLPTSPVLVLIVITSGLVLLALRDAAPNLFAGLQLVTGQHIKVGDYLKLENGEEGCVIKIQWDNTQLQTAGGDKLTIPNSQLMRQRIINIISQLEKGKEVVPPSILSEREIEIARLVSRGATNKEIAEKLFIAENTVKVHVKNILRKLVLKNRQQLAVYTVLKEGEEPHADIPE